MHNKGNGVVAMLATMILGTILTVVSPLLILPFDPAF